MPDPDKRILTINSGSSSIKFSVYSFGLGTERLVFSGVLERVGLEGGSFNVKDQSGKAIIREASHLPDHDSALRRLFEWLKDASGLSAPDAVGHRIVHGGKRYTSHGLIDQELLKALRDLEPFATEHLPHEIKAIEAVKRNYPEIVQSACFDTAFHSSMPWVARTFALPSSLREEGVVRYGFHGLSYEFITEELAGAGDGKTASGRIIIAHLGNGASMAAVLEGRGVDTTMGFTPAGGLMMSRRSGDLDPGVILYLLRSKKLGAEDLNRLINERSGLLGVSGISSDMRDLLAREGADERARAAVDLFCYTAKKFIGALAAALGGLDGLIFTAGIGENSPQVRARICEGLDFLGIWIDKELNSVNAGVISRKGAPVSVMVMKTNEELMIARHTRRMIG